MVTLARGHISVFSKYFQRASSLKILGQCHLNFICSLLAKGGKNSYISSMSHNQTWPPCPYMVKNT